MNPFLKTQWRLQNRRTDNKYPNVAEYAKDMEEEITAGEATCRIKRMKGTEGIVICQIEHNILSQFANDTHVLFFSRWKGWKVWRNMYSGHRNTNIISMI